jgi:hypothetical protein
MAAEVLKYSAATLRIINAGRRTTMSARSTVIQVATKTGMLIAALFVVSVLLAAIPQHKQQTGQPLVALNGDLQPGLPETDSQKIVVRASDEPAQESQQQPASAPAATPDEKASEQAAVHDMTRGNHDTHASHMTMTEMRQATPGDAQRANEIVEQLRSGIEKYKDYHVALADGFHIFVPNVPQPEYHFTSYHNGFLQAFSFDPARPTSLLYKKTSTGYELVGAMYTMPKRATEDQLNARVPLSVAMWHLHTNLCMPPHGELRSADWTKFGLQGSIASKDGCDAAGGRFSPVVFGWMVHVYPYEDSLDKVFAMHNHLD